MVHVHWEGGFDMRATFRYTFPFLALLALAPDRACADFITYNWNDDQTGSTFYGSFTIDLSMLPDAGGGEKLLSMAGITSSSFHFNRGIPAFLGVTLNFEVTGVSATGIVIDPTTGAVLSDGSLLFGSSNTVESGGSVYQVLGGTADFNTQYNIGEIGFPGGESVYLDTTWSGHTFASTGHWDVAVTHTPVPPTIVLAGAGMVCALFFAFARGRAASWESVP
jgi:hypothetical protein